MGKQITIYIFLQSYSWTNSLDLLGLNSQETVKPKWTGELNAAFWMPWTFCKTGREYAMHDVREPRLSTVVSKTKHSKTKTEARSTQISKTKHPKLENEAPRSRKRSTQNSKTKHPKLENEAPYLENEAPKKLDTGLSFINTRPM